MLFVIGYPTAKSSGGVSVSVSSEAKCAVAKL